MWNDRPQAGSVHHDQAIKLLIDRNSRSVDRGGVGENIYDSMSNDPLHLNFEVAFSDLPINKSYAVRERTLLTFASIGYELNTDEQTESDTWLSN